LLRRFDPGGAVGTIATVTSAVSVREPEEFVRRRLNTVDWVTRTVLLPESGTGPIPWSNLAVSAPVDVQERVTSPPPAGTVDDETSSVPEGRVAAWTVTSAVSVREPEEFVRRRWNTVDWVTRTVLLPESGTGPIP
jgi:hypothetical protein